MRQQLGESLAAPAMLAKGESRTGQFQLAADKGETPAGQQRFRAFLAVAFYQLGLRVKQIELRGRSDHVQVDDPFGPRGEMRRLRRQRIPGSSRGFAQERSQRQGAEAEAGALKEMTAMQEMRMDHGQSFVMVSSRFSSALAMESQASSGLPVAANSES
jgi:hypothetical protein